MMTDTPTEFWWPSPDSFNDLEVSDIEEGWKLSAPDGTELSEWLNYWNQSEEHHELFQAVFLKALTDHANLVIDDFEQNGKNQDLPDRNEPDSEQAEDVSAG
jgi:hypothetical protein